MSKNFDLQLFLAEAIERKNGVSLFQQIYEGLRQAILFRRLRVGMRLPPTRHLAQELKVSRNTVMGAFEQLIAEGYLTGKQGSGTFVAEELPDDLLQARAESLKVRPQKNSVRKIAKRGKSLSYAAFSFSTESNKPRAFQTGLSAIDEFPLEIWARIVAKRLRKMPRTFLDYGDSLGFLPLREAIAEYLTVSRGARCEASQIIIVAGSQQGLDLAARVLLDKGDEVWIEDPNYPGAHGALLGAGAKLAPVPIDGEGINVKAGKQRAKKACAVYVTPSHQFPLGVVMSLSRRLELLEWANQSSAWIIEDDYDSEFRYNGKPLAALQGLDNHNRVIYLGTFSKVLFPSLRLGYLVVPPDLVEPFGKAQAITMYQTALLEQVVLTDFINAGYFGRHVRRMRALYGERQAALIQAIRKDLHDFLDVEEDSAGMHLVAWLKGNLNAVEIAEMALQNGVYVSPISFYCIKAKLREGILLGYTGINPTEIRRGAKRLQMILQSLSK
ncbi:MAG: PLP-dependent aminotransferase family protein [Acidobacteriota bacterium]